MDNMAFLAADNQLRSLSGSREARLSIPLPAEYPDIYDNISKQLRHQYSIRFAPSNLKKDGKFHKLRVDVVDLDLNKDGKRMG
jgi:hypothetical protein